MNMIVQPPFERQERSHPLYSGIHSIPSIPVVISEVNRLLESPKASAAELGKVIRIDQGLVTKILSVANSPLYGLPRRVATIEFAIIILGFDHIKNIVIALSMLNIFKNKSDKNFRKREYWLHSFICASGAKRIAEDLGYSNSGEVFTAGLLHDLGIPVIHKYAGSDFSKILKLADTPGYTYHTAEKEVLGITHEDVCLYLSQKWNLPKTLSEAIYYHHTPSKAKESKVLASIIHLADFMTTKLQAGNFQLDKDITLDESIIDILHFGSDTYLDKFIESYRDLFNQQAETATF